MQHANYTKTQKALEQGLNLCLRDLHLRASTQWLILKLRLNLPLGSIEVLRFGIETQQHYHALQAVVDAAHDVIQLRQIAQELDKAEIGAQLNRLVTQYAPTYQAIRFETFIDRLYL